METVEVLIKLPKELYQMIKEDTLLPKNYAINEAIQNGTVLPKGHGDLKDANYMKREGIINRGNYNSIKGVREWIDEAPTIIEADKEVDNGENKSV